MVADAIAEAVALLLTLAVNACFCALLVLLANWALGLSLNPLRVGVLLAVVLPLAVAFVQSASERMRG